MKLTTLLALILAAVAIAACGDDAETKAPTSDGADGGTAVDTGDSGTEAQNGTLKFEVARKGLAYTTTEASAPAGKLEIELKNPQLEAHDVTIEDAKGKWVAQTFLISETSDSRVVNLKPGEYTFYCSVRGHREAGMEGPLTVE